MEMQQIIETCKEENLKSIPNYIKDIQSKLESVEGGDMTFPRDIIYQIEQKCDELEIPAYKVNVNCLSVARTYSILLNREKSR